MSRWVTLASALPLGLLFTASSAYADVPAGPRGAFGLDAHAMVFLGGACCLVGGGIAIGGAIVFFILRKKRKG